MAELDGFFGTSGYVPLYGPQGQRDLSALSAVQDYLPEGFGVGAAVAIEVDFLPGRLSGGVEGTAGVFLNPDGSYNDFVAGAGLLGLDASPGPGPELVGELIISNSVFTDYVGTSTVLEIGLGYKVSGGLGVSVPSDLVGDVVFSDLIARAVEASDGSLDSLVIEFLTLAPLGTSVYPHLGMGGTSANVEFQVTLAAPNLEGALEHMGRGILLSGFGFMKFNASSGGTDSVKPNSLGQNPANVDPAIQMAIAAKYGGDVGASIVAGLKSSGSIPNSHGYDYFDPTPDGDLSDAYWIDKYGRPTNGPLNRNVPQNEQAWKNWENLKDWLGIGGSSSSDSAAGNPTGKTPKSGVPKGGDGGSKKPPSGLKTKPGVDKTTLTDEEKTGTKGPKVKPILLDLTGAGIEITELSQSNVFMDADNDGLQNKIAWAAAGNGVLFYDAGIVNLSDLAEKEPHTLVKRPSTHM